MLTGTLIIPPVLHIKAEFGMFIGGILGTILIGVIYPESGKSSEKQLERQYGPYLFFFHPTQLPLILSGILLILIIILAFLLKELNIQVSPEVFQVGLLGMAFLWGLSGFLMITRNEFIGSGGQNHKGFWAILNGILLISMGWGYIIFVVLATISNW